MTDSARRSQSQMKQDHDRDDTETQNHRVCDFCTERTALIYCRADSAKLCLSCDREVHSTNQLFTKHTRSLLCDSCDSSPASIFCSTDGLVLCQNCDWENHNHSLSSLHERRPVEGFNGCPSVNELLSFVGFEDVTKKALFGGDDDDDDGGFGLEGYCNLLVWDTPSIVTLDDLIDSNNSQHSFQAMGVPPLPKNRKAACGKHKEDILSQLREMAKSEPGFNDGQEDIESAMQFLFPVPEQDLHPGGMYTDFRHGSGVATMPPDKGDSFWCIDDTEIENQSLPSKLQGSGVEDNCVVPDKDLDIGGTASHACYGHDGQPLHHFISETSQVLPITASRELTSQERDSAISRYKEKKRTRRYDKHVRYESRKIRAESRTRIKGRFAKIEH